MFVEIKTDGPLTCRGEEDDSEVQVASEAVGFRSRESGRGLRTKIANLLRADPAARVHLDWRGVPLASSSVADEVMGRLFVELGPVQFGARVRSTGMEPVVQELVGRAILQRSAQSFG